MSARGNAMNTTAGMPWMGQSDGAPQQQVKTAEEIDPATGKVKVAANNTTTNTSVDDDILATLWKDADKDTKTANDPPQQQTTQQQQAPVDPKKQLADYMDTVGLGEVKYTPEALQEMISSPEKLGEALSVLNARSQKAHLEALKNMDAMVKPMIEEAVKKATESSQNFFHGENLKALLAEKLPWTKDELIQPVAETVLKRALGKGRKPEDAINDVKRYFNEVSNRSGNNKTNQNSRGPLHEGMSDPADEPKWDEILRG